MRGAWRVRQFLRHLDERTVRLLPLVRCNICHWSGRHLDSDGWHPHTICPRCGSHVRHRLLAAALSAADELGLPGDFTGKRVLHFAPEPPVTALLRRHPCDHTTADLTRPDVDRHVDISAMPSFPDDAFDVVLAMDVLEHVPDDRAALREIFRILAAGGYAILSVPQQDGLAATYEDERITNPQDRERAFGQADHLRIYGDDFGEHCAAAGFEVRVISASDFVARDVKRSVLLPPRPSPHPLATNNRRIYFARKPLCAQRSPQPVDLHQQQCDVVGRVQ